MLNSAETTTGSTIVSVPSLPQSPSQDSTASVFSYAIGPLDPVYLTSIPAHFSSGEACSLVVPTVVSPAILAHPVFTKGYEWGYLEGHVEDETWTVPKLLNEVYTLLTDLYDEPENPGFFFWTLGFVLGELARMAEQDTTLARTGLAHYCFLLPLFTQERPSSWPRYEPYHAGLWHTRVVKAYRARVRGYREQGMSFDEAQRLAFC